METPVLNNGSLVSRLEKSWRLRNSSKRDLSPSKKQQPKPKKKPKKGNSEIIEDALGILDRYSM